jgi:glycosyltransferase involved in cell wall biosynthesis
MLTILMPTYNAARFLHYSINSILNQTHQDFEFLIVDDGSTDNTQEIINSYSDGRINYIKKQHSGLADTLNYGLQFANYDWVARMDADDISHPQRIEKQFLNDNIKYNTISCTWAMYFQNNRVKYLVETPINNFELRKQLLLHNYINHFSVLFHRKFILENGGYDISLSKFEDYELWLRLKEKAYFKIINEYLVFSHISKQSLGRSNFSVDKKIVYQIQVPYINQMTLSQKAWREYFYGDRKAARKLWFQNPVFIINDYRIIFAIILSFSNLKIFEFIKGKRLRLRLDYFFKKLLNGDKIKLAEKEFNSTIERNRY